MLKIINQYIHIYSVTDFFLEFFYTSKLFCDNICISHKFVVVFLDQGLHQYD